MSLVEQTARARAMDGPHVIGGLCSTRLLRRISLNLIFLCRIQTFFPLPENTAHHGANKSHQEVREEPS